MSTPASAATYKYEPGDRVVCVVDGFRDLEFGKVYTINYVHENWDHLQLEGDWTWWKAEYFRPDTSVSDSPGTEQAEASDVPKTWSDIKQSVLENSLVNQPQHYQNGLGVEVIDIIREYFADNYNLGNVLKYLLRADKKGERQQDLEKALMYLTWEVERGKESHG